MHKEHHFSTNSSWLRAAVLGANDGIISMSGLVVGLTATGTETENVILGSVSALIAGAISMFAGEYISVSSQADSEKEDIKREKQSLLENPEEEFQELVQVYEEKGLSSKLAYEVATELTKTNPLKHHLKEEINYEEGDKANPLQAGFVSFTSFLIGGGMPTLLVIVTEKVLVLIYPVTLIGLALLGYFSARTGGVPPLRPIFRITSVGIFVLLLTQFIGNLYS